MFLVMLGDIQDNTVDETAIVKSMHAIPHKTLPCGNAEQEAICLREDACTCEWNVLRLQLHV